LRIVFPPPGAVANDSIVVRGASSFSDAVGAIHVNGVAATSSDGFATYRAVVPLQQGDNKIVVTAENKGAAALGTAEVTVQRFADEASIHRGGGDAFSIFRLFGFDVDVSSGDAILCDDIYDGLVRVELATGNRALASASESSAKGMVGKGYNDIAQPRDVVIDAPGHALLVDGPKLVGVDLKTGDRTLLSGGGTGSGPEAHAVRRSRLRWDGRSIDRARLPDQRSLRDRQAGRPLGALQRHGRHRDGFQRLWPGRARPRAWSRAHHARALQSDRGHRLEERESQRAFG
jgi:hypothetical protein